MEKNLEVQGGRFDGGAAGRGGGEERGRIAAATTTGRRTEKARYSSSIAQESVGEGSSAPPTNTATRRLVTQYSSVSKVRIDRGIGFSDVAVVIADVVAISITHKLPSLIDFMMATVAT